jgi:hypothetical protein
MVLNDHAPVEPQLTDYDRSAAPAYLRLLDAEEAGASWEEASKFVLGLDPDADLERARLAYTSHLERARWLRDSGYRSLFLEKDS